ncbi:MAG: hypothetical protein AMXMBFR84_30520 [Candidatus Hydrogenedentota bacterium]
MTGTKIKTNRIGSEPANDRIRPGGAIRALLGLDLLGAAASSFAALTIRFAGAPPWQNVEPYVYTFAVLLAVRLFAAYASGLYDFRHKLTTVDHGFAAVGAAFWGVATGYLMLTGISFYYRPEWELSRWVALLDFLLLAAWFAASRSAALAWLRRRGYELRLALVGDPTACRELAQEVHREAPVSIRLAGYYTTSESHQDSGALGSMTNPGTAAELELADQIILAGIDPSLTVAPVTLSRIDPRKTEFFLFPGLDLSLLAGTRIMRVAGLPVVPLRSAYLYSAYRPIKRIADVLGAVVLLIAALPVMAVAAAAIRWTSPGPALFVQDRVGLNGSSFRMIKLRTMIPNAEANSGAILSTEGDPRITPLGRILRRYRIDELPQLWNVLRGEMSFVGPRPERREFVDQFVQENPLYEWRFQVRPGLTGLAQIHGRYDTDYKHKLRYDLVYINTVSFPTDARILYATIRTVLTGQGAL